MHGISCLALFALVLSPTFWHDVISQTPAHIILLASTVAVIVQGLKRLAPNVISGHIAIALNVATSVAAVFVGMNPAQFWSETTLLSVLTVVATAAGIHSTARSLAKDSTDPGPVDETPASAPAPQLVVKTVIVLAMCLGMAGLSGCSDWERTTFQSLSASKATIDQAQADYEAGTIKQTAVSFKAINDLKAAQTLAVNSMVTYESIKAAKGTATALSAQQSIVTAALAQIGPLIAAVKGLSTTVTSQLMEWPRSRPRLALAA